MEIDFAVYKGCLAHLAFNDMDCLGRRDGTDDEEKCYHGIIRPFELDIIKLLNCKARRRQPGKTQVLTCSLQSHTRTRIIHTDEVVSYFRMAARILGLNYYLCEAIALGHDIGHAPLGHFGEEILSDFRH